MEKDYIQFHKTLKAYDCKQAAKNQAGTTETLQPMLQIEGNTDKKRNFVCIDSDDESSVSSDDSSNEPNPVNERTMRKNYQNTAKLDF